MKFLCLKSWWHYILVYNKIGYPGAIALAESLKTNNTLRSLYLDRNEIGDAGATALFEALKENQALQTLYLRGNQIGDQGVNILVCAILERYERTSIILKTECLAIDQKVKGRVSALKNTKAETSFMDHKNDGH